ncbi:hypothetical protein ABT034_33800 [Streptomyces sp. NPDC002773]|uniref:hypothetical protein n=1 Tax=Streptomyces sp. NPDC002773 TaxID=3154430 RepID=UPI0033213F31
MSTKVTHSHITQLIRSAVRDGELAQAALFVEADLPLTARDALVQAATAQHRIDELNRRLGFTPDAYSQWPLMAELHRTEAVRDRAAFLAAVLDETVTAVAA